MSDADHKQDFSDVVAMYHNGKSLAAFYVGDELKWSKRSKFKLGAIAFVYISTDHCNATINIGQTKPNSVYIDWNDGSKSGFVSSLDASFQHTYSSEWIASQPKNQDGYVTTKPIYVYALADWSPGYGTTNGFLAYQPTERILLIQFTGLTYCKGSRKTSFMSMQNLQLVEFFGSYFVMDMYMTFYACRSLKTFYIAYGRIGSVDRLSFYLCESLEEVDVSQIDSIDSDLAVARECNSKGVGEIASKVADHITTRGLASVYLPANLEIKAKTIGDEAFHQNWPNFDITKQVMDVKIWLRSSIESMGSLIFANRIYEGEPYITIYAEPDSKPEGWANDFNQCTADKNISVIWGVKAQPW